MSDSDRASIQLDQFISDREAVLTSSIGPRISLTLHLATTGGAVFASIAELEYLLMTVVANAVEAMPNGGALTLSTAWIDRVSLPPPATAQPRRYLRLTVGDTGDVIGNNPHARLFGEISAHGSGSDTDPDTVAAALWRLNGWLIAEGVPEAGTRVHLCLPASSEDEA